MTGSAGAQDHRPVMLVAVTAGLAIRSGGIYVDGTFGRGGHARAILEQLGPRGRLLAFDKDPQAVAAGREQFFGDGRLILEQGSFSMLGLRVEQFGWQGKVDGVLLDLGVSSPQLDDPGRGFSFTRDGPLDMRMDPSIGPSAAQWLALATQAEIARVLQDYGEERYHRRIARAIVAERARHPITTTSQLASIVARANPRWEAGRHPATRSFQAIRIHVNAELEELEAVLPQAVAALALGGRLAVLSFHSLEDRIVKRFIRSGRRGPALPRDLPVREQPSAPRLHPIGRATRPEPQEVAQNPRARSAILRIAERLA